jgi:hypothetical protein
LFGRHRSRIEVSIVVQWRTGRNTDIANDGAIFGVVAVVALLEESLLGGLGDREGHGYEGRATRGMVVLLEVKKFVVDWGLSCGINF